MRHTLAPHDRQLVNGKILTRLWPLWLGRKVRSPISAPLARYEQAQKMRRQSLLTNSELYFNPWDTIIDANPQRILERGESVTLPPMFVLQGALDDNVLPAVQARFVETYRGAGGEIDCEVFPGAEHRWIVEPGPQTERAITMIKAFIARQVRARQPVRS